MPWKFTWLKNHRYGKVWDFLWWFLHSVWGLYGLGDANHEAHVAKNNERRSQFSSSATLPHWHQKSWKKESSIRVLLVSLDAEADEISAPWIRNCKNFFSLFATTTLLTLVELLLYSLITVNVTITCFESQLKVNQNSQKSAEY